MKLILVRHGETKENDVGILQGQLHGELNKSGLKQVEKVALRLRNEKIDFIFASDLKRALDTAIAIAKYHPDIPFKKVEDLRERFGGSNEGKKLREIDWSISPKKYGAETSAEIEKRAKFFLHKILVKHKNDSLLLVCHGGIGKALINAITGIDFKKIEHLHNTSVSVFEISEDKSYKILLLNCDVHLKK